MSNSISLKNTNTIDRQFAVVFTERLYAGAPRWFVDESEWRGHSANHRNTDPARAPFDRDGRVRQAIRDCHQAEPLMWDRHDWWYQTCTNAGCSHREQWGVLRRDLHGSTEKHDRLKIARGLGLTALSEKPDALYDGLHLCSECGEAKRTYPVRQIENKWIYILKEQAGAVSYYAEIDTGRSWIGRLHDLKPNGDHRSGGERHFDGTLGLRPEPTAYTWHFFLSPVRLGPKAKRLLREVVADGGAARTPAVHARALWSGCDVPGHDWLDVGLQPWAPVVTLRFTQERIDSFASGRDPYWEVIPLVDPFAWVAQAVEADYLPALAAKLEAVRNPQEQARAFVAAALSQAAGRQVTDPKAHPIEWTEDKWDIVDETVPVPSGESGANAAEAWRNRYRAALKYLAQQTNAACARVTLPLRFGLGHRIVELACQEAAADAPDDFALGLAHWHHVLQQLPACNEGKAFLAWLTGSGDSAHDALAPDERMPVRNVLGGEGITGNTTLARRAGGLAAQLYGTLAPAVIAANENGDAAGTVVEQLGRLDVPATSFGGKDLMSTAKWAIAIPDSVLDDYGTRVVGPFTSDALLDSLKVTAFKQRLQTFRDIKEFHGTITLFLALAAYGKSSKRDATNYERRKSGQAMVQAPIDVAGFITKSSRGFLKARMSSETLAILEAADTLTPEVEAILAKGGYGDLLASRSVRAYDLLGKVTKGISGPVALVMGGSEIVIQGDAAMDAWRAQDPGAAVGHGIQAIAGVMVVAVAATECAALLTGAASAAWAGPVGWIAAAVLLIGAVVVTVWSKNDLEHFARHCFLGKAYGEGDFDDHTGRSWMGGRSWPELRYASAASRSAGDEEPGRFQRQRLALLRLMSGFRTWWGPQTHPEIPPAGVEVWPTHVDHAANSRFVVEIDIRQQGKVNPVESYRADVWPLARDWRWRGRQPKYDWVRFHAGDGPTVKFFQVYVEPADVPGPYWVEARVRLRFDALGASLPASGSSVYNGSFVKGVETKYFQRYAASGDVD